MPPANPHNRKTGPAEEEEEEDLVDKLIRNTGCEKQHYLVQVWLLFDKIEICASLDVAKQNSQFDICSFQS